MINPNRWQHDELSQAIHLVEKTEKMDVEPALSKANVSLRSSQKQTKWQNRSFSAARTIFSFLFT